MLSDDIKHELLKNLHLTISDEQIPFEYGLRLKIKISWEDTEIASDFIDIRKDDFF